MRFGSCNGVASSRTRKIVVSLCLAARDDGCAAAERELGAGADRRSIRGPVHRLDRPFARGRLYLRICERGAQRRHGCPFFGVEKMGQIDGWFKGSRGHSANRHVRFVRVPLRLLDEPHPLLESLHAPLMRCAASSAHHWLLL